MASQPPTYEQATRYDQFPPRLDHIWQATKARRKRDLETKMSYEALDLAGFLLQVLEIDYQTATCYKLSSRRHAKFRDCALQLHALRQSTKEQVNTNLDTKGSNLQDNIYKPAVEIDVLPEVVEMVLAHFLRYSSEDGYRSGCIRGVLQDYGVEALIEKLCWDYWYWNSRLSRFDYDYTRQAPLLAGVVKTTRNYVSREHLWRRVVENDIAESDRLSIQGVRKLLAETPCRCSA